MTSKTKNWYFKTIIIDRKSRSTTTKIFLKCAKILDALEKEDSIFEIYILNYLNCY